MNQELSAEKIKAFCEAWQIAAQPGHWRSLRDENHGLNSKPGDYWMPEGYPPLTLELLLGVLQSSNLRVRLYQNGKFSTVDIASQTEAFPTQRELLPTEKTMTECVILAMARFKGIEL